MRRTDSRRDASSRQHFSLHSVETFALTDTKFDFHSVMGVVLVEETVVDDKLGIGPGAIEDIDL